MITTRPPMCEVLSVFVTLAMALAAVLCRGSAEADDRSEPISTSSTGHAVAELKGIGAHVLFTDGVPTGVNLNGTDVADEDLSHLARLTSVQEIWLNGTQISDEGIAYLRNLSNIHTLSLAETRITDMGLAYLRDLKNLQAVYLGDTNVSDRGIMLLCRHKEIRRLTVARTLISENGLAQLTTLQQLEYLDICDTDVNDAGVRHLAKLPQLKHLHAGYTYLRGHKKKGDPGWIDWTQRRERLTQAGLDDLRKRMPDTSISPNIEEF